jgi:UDP-N-acetylglucosamine acyltransferase
MSSIHPSAVIHPKAQLGANCVVSPYVVIDASVEVGPECHIGPHAYLTGHTVIGCGNHIHAGAVLGDAPQDLKYRDAPTQLIVGNHNVFREHTTVHRANNVEHPTRIGNENYFMGQSHVGHNSVIGHRNIFANGALLAGHVTVMNRVFISGNCLVHQFCRIGTLALMQGGAGISKDLPPFCIARGDNAICGLNIVGLRRANVSPEERLALKKAYHLLFRSRLPLSQAVSQSRESLADFPLVEELLRFLETSQRGHCTDFTSR